MKAYHNDPAVRESFFAKLKEASKTGEHILKDFVEDIGIPNRLGVLFIEVYETYHSFHGVDIYDSLFESLSIGVSYSRVWNDFIIWLFTNPTYNLLRFYEQGSSEEQVIHSFLKLVNEAKNIDIDGDLCPAVLDTVLAPLPPFRYDHYFFSGKTEELREVFASHWAQNNELHMALRDRRDFGWYSSKTILNGIIKLKQYHGALIASAVTAVWFNELLTTALKNVSLNVFNQQRSVYLGPEIKVNDPVFAAGKWRDGAVSAREVTNQYVHAMKEKLIDLLSMMDKERKSS